MTARRIAGPLVPRLAGWLITRAVEVVLYYAGVPALVGLRFLL